VLTDESRRPAVRQRDTYELGAQADLVRPKLIRASEIVAESYAAERPEAVFMDRIAEGLQPSSRSLARHVGDPS
ncbi:Mycobacterium terramassiliense ORFan, partial [Mycobacterium terramassiliense]